MSSEFPAVAEVLPHRYPFLLIDKIVELSLDTDQVARVAAVKNVTINEEFFQGHFPGHPIMPGVLTLEALAQASGYLGLLLAGEERAANMILYFAGTDHVRFKRPVLPGDQLQLEAIFNSSRRGVWKFECNAKVDGELVCSADIICAEKGIRS